jgi:hypothetical protein
VTAQEYWSLARDRYFAQIRNTAQTSSKITEWNDDATTDESLREEERLAAKLLAAIESNEAGEARKIINGADIRRLPYSQGRMVEYQQNIILNFQRSTNPDLSHIHWTAVHFLIVSKSISDEDKLHAVKILIANSGFHLRQALTMKNNGF